MLGLFIGIGHLASRLYGVNPADLMKADGMLAQRRFFEEELAPLFNNRLIRWTTSLLHFGKGRDICTRIFAIVRLSTAQHG